LACSTSATLEAQEFVWPSSQVDQPPVFDWEKLDAIEAWYAILAIAVLSWTPTSMHGVSTGAFVRWCFAHDVVLSPSAAPGLASAGAAWGDQRVQMSVRGRWCSGVSATGLPSRTTM